MRSIVGNINSHSFNKILVETFQRIKQSPYIDYQSGPEKKFEIYCINNDNTKLIIGYTDEFVTEKKSQSLSALFYNKNNAIEVYNLLELLNNNPCNSFPELLEDSQDEIQNIQYQIDLIKNNDENEYRNDLHLYNQFVHTYYYMNKNQAFEALANDNSKLQNKFDALNMNQAKMLNKFKFVINKYEELSNNSKESSKIISKFLKKILKK